MKLFSTLLVLISCAALTIGQRTGDVRLAGFESTRLMGRLELYASGNWFGVCNDNFGWAELAVACRQLGLGNGVRVYNSDTDAGTKTGVGSEGRTDSAIVRFGGASIIGEGNCNGNENALLNCGFTTSHDCLSTEAVGIQCSEYRPQPYSGQVRLVGGAYSSEGIVEVYFNGQWGVVCDSGFNQNAATAVCRQLGHNAASFTIGDSSYGSPSSTAWVISASCGGSERCLSSCLSSAPSTSGSCPANGFATVKCDYNGAVVNVPGECELSSTPGEGSLRLHNGTHVVAQRGTLQIYRSGQWGEFCGQVQNYNRQSLDVICRQLGYRTWNTAGAVTSTTRMHFTNISCTGVENAVSDCQTSTSTSQCSDSNKHLHVTCHPDKFTASMYGTVTLSARTDGAGLLLVAGHGGYSPVCDQDFDTVDGRVACRQLGYDDVYAVRRGSYYGGTGNTVSITHIDCEGSESHLLSCDHRNDTHQRCDSTSLAGLHCNPNASDTNRGNLRLSGGNSSSGALEIQLDGEWQAVCFLLFSNNSADVACRQLGFSGGAVSFSSDGQRLQQDTFTSTHCRGSEQRLYDCLYITLASGVCSGAVRLSCDTGVVSCNPACVNGRCSQSGVCECARGWSGVDCNAPVLEVMFSPDDYEVSEGEVAPVTLVTNLPYTVDFSVTVVCENGSAVAPEDFAGGEYNVTFMASPNATGRSSVEVPTSPDMVFEDLEFFRCVLVIPPMDTDNVVKGEPDMARVNITDSTGADCFFNPDVYLVDEGQNLTLRVETSVTVAQRFSCIVATSDDSATSPSDYMSGTRVAIFEVGSNSVTVTYNIVQDDVREGLETFRATLTVSEAMLAMGVRLEEPDTAVVDIRDDEELFVMFSRTMYMISEGDPPGDVLVNITLIATRGCEDEYTVKVTALDGSALEGEDYRGQSFPVTFPPLTTSMSFLVPIISDDVFEPDEAFTLQLEAPQNMDGMCRDVRLGNPDRATILIRNDDSVNVYFDPDTYNVTEGETAIITLRADSNFTVLFDVNVTLRDGSAVAPGDYDSTQSPYTVTFLPGQLIQTITVPTRDDDTVEMTEVFNAVLQDSPTRGVNVIEPDEATVNIFDNDGLCDPPCKNGACSEDMRCVCSEGWTGEDCSTPVCSPPCVNGVCSQEMVCECDDEWIGEDCSTPGVSITLDTSRLTVLENQTSVEFCLLKSRQTSVNISAMVIPSEVLDELSSGSGILDGDFDSAEEGRDFESAPQEIQIPSDVIRRCFQLTITDDAILEREEIFHFSVMFMKERSLQSMGIQAMDLNGSVIIDNDDEVTVQFEMASYEQLESEGTFIVKITASGQASFRYSLALTTMDIEAKQPSDYNLSSTVTFQAGEEFVLLPIAIINDDVFEPNETFKVIMTLPDDVTIPGIRVGKNNVTLVRILNDDPVEVSSSLEPSTTVISSSLEPSTTVISSSLEPFTTVASSSLDLPTSVMTTALESSSDVVVSSSSVLATPSPTPQPTPPSVFVSFERSQYTAKEGGPVVISLVSNLTAEFNYTVEISLNDVNTTSGPGFDSDYYDDSINVTFFAGETSADFTVYIIDDRIVERTESFQCSIKSVFSSQDVPFSLDSDKSTTLVIINDDDYLSLVFYGYSSESDPYNRVIHTALENVSIVPLYIDVYGDISFEYKVQLYVDQQIEPLPGQGKATEGHDFVLPEPVVFRPYQTAAIVNVTILNDRVLEPIVEAFTLGIQGVGDLEGKLNTSVLNLVLIEIIDDDACSANFIFPRTSIGETRSVPCASIAGGSGMIGEMRSTCTSEGVWGSVDMSRCTFRKDVPTLPILWRVELYGTNLTDLEGTITSITKNHSTERTEQSTGEKYRITKISGSVDDEPHTYLVQFSDNAIYALARDRLFWNIGREVTVIRYAGCDCCASGQVDLNNRYGGVRLCDVDVVSAPVPCSCENDMNKCALRFVKSVNGCRLDTDRDGIADREDPCVGCCVGELNIFEWPKTDHGSSSEANCSQLHPSFGDSKVRRTCRVNDVWDPVDIGSCTFKNTTTRSTPILLFNATVNDNNTDTVKETLEEQAASLLPNNGSSFNVTEVAFVASSISGQRVVFFVIEFSENTTLEENFITTIKNDTVNLIEAVIPSDNCSCSSNRSNDLRRLCIGTATAPCDCERRGTCQCVDPYITEPGGTCTLDTDGDGIADYKDICPLEHGIDCRKPTPPPAQSDCPREKDTTWNLLWRQTQRSQTRVQRCPNGIMRSAGLASRRCMENGQWGEVDATKCVSRAFQAISENNEDVNRVLDSAVNNDLPLTTEERETVVEVAEELSNALDNTAAENTSVLPGDLTITTQVINGLADLSENNGLFNIENPREQQEVVANVLNRVLDSDNAPAFTATRQNTPAVSILESTEQLARSGFTNQNISFVPPVTVNQTVNQEEIVQENFAIQSNRFNPQSFMQPTFQVSFPKVSLSAFANRNLVPQIVIPGDFLSALLPGPISTTENPLSATEATATNPTTAPGATAGPSSLSENPVDVVSFTMNNLQEHLPLQLADKGDAERIDRFEAGSLIVSSQVTGVDSTAVNTGPTVNLSFSLLQGDDKNVEAGPNEQIEIKCAAWNFTGGPNGTGGWSFDGIEVVSVNDTHVECTSKHLTSFIVLVSVVPLEGPPHPVFNVFTYIGCSISLVCLLISIIFFISLRKELIKRLHNFVHLNLCIALACGLIVFIAGMEHATSIQVACVIVSVLQHYFFLAAFSWMLCEAVMIYILLVRVFRANDRKWIYLYLSLGWGLPVPIVIVSVAIRHYEYFIADPVSNEIFACWLPVKDGVIAAFIAPMLAILLVNAVLLTISMASLAKSKCGQKQEMKEEKRQGAQTAWQLTKAVLILMPLMGFTWVIGLLAVGPGRDAVAFVFIVLNSLQGLFIFILHVVRHEKVWGKIKTRLPTIREGKLTFWTSHGSSATKSTLYSKSRKQSTLSSKHYASTMSGHDPGLMYSETKDKPLDEASIKDGEIEGLVLEVKNGENSGDEPNPGVSATTFGITEPTNGAQETSISTPPPESTTTPDNEQPITLATSFGFVPLTEQGDPLPSDTPQTEPESTFL